MRTGQSVEANATLCRLEHLTNNNAAFEAGVVRNGSHGGSASTLDDLYADLLIHVGALRLDLLQGR